MRWSKMATAYIIVGVATVVLWILDKGPFFPPFGSSSTANSEGEQ